MKKQIWKYILNIMIIGTMLLYLFVLYYFTIGKSSASTINGVAYSANIAPFRTIIEYISFILNGGGKRNIAILNLVGNIILTMPLAVYIAYFIKPLRKLWKTLLGSLVVIFIIEVVQFFTERGSFDIDDIILNLLGVIIGYGIWKIRPVQWLVKKCQL